MCVALCASCKAVATRAVVRQSVTTQRAAAGGRHLRFTASDEGARFPPSAGFTLYFSARRTSANIRSAGTTARLKMLYAC